MHSNKLVLQVRLSDAGPHSWLGSKETGCTVRHSQVGLFTTCPLCDVPSLLLAALQVKKRGGSAATAALRIGRVDASALGDEGAPARGGKTGGRGAWNNYCLSPCQPARHALFVFLTTSYRIILLTGCSMTSRVQSKHRLPSATVNLRQGDCYDTDSVTDSARPNLKNTASHGPTYGLPSCRLSMITGDGDDDEDGDGEAGGSNRGRAKKGRAKEDDVEEGQDLPGG